MIFHEFSHAIHSWLGSVFAVPTPFGFTLSFSTDRNAFVGLVVFAGIIFMGMLAVKHALSGMGTLAAILLMAQFYLTFVANEDRRIVAIIYGGCAGEFLIPALIVVGFFCQGPPAWRWDFWRFPALFVSAIVLAYASSQWFVGVAKFTQMPLFGLHLKATDAAADMSKLRDAYGWADWEVFRVYRRLGRSAWVLIGLSYALSLVRHYREKYPKLAPQVSPGTLQ